MQFTVHNLAYVCLHLPGVPTELQLGNGFTQTRSHPLAPSQIPTIAKPSAASLSGLQMAAKAAVITASSLRCPCSWPLSCWASGCMCLEQAIPRADTLALHLGGILPFLLGYRKAILCHKVPPLARHQTQNALLKTAALFCLSLVPQ